MSRRPAVGALAGAGRILFKTSAHAVDREAKIISVQFSRQDANAHVARTPGLPRSNCCQSRVDLGQAPFVEASDEGRKQDSGVPFGISHPPKRVPTANERAPEKIRVVFLV